MHHFFSESFMNLMTAILFINFKNLYLDFKNLNLDFILSYYFIMVFKKRVYEDMEMIYIYDRLSIS